MTPLTERRSTEVSPCWKISLRTGSSSWVILVPVLIVKFGQKKKDEGGGPQ